MKRNHLYQCMILLGLLTLSKPVQASFQEGYVVTVTGDTLYGKIDMEKTKSMKQHCRFKSAVTGKVTRYSPKELKSFATVDLSRRFISGTVPYFIKDRHIFLEVLQLGRLNLYYTYDAVLNDLFYVNKRDAELVDLLYDWDKNKLVPLKADYISLLKKAMLDAPQLILDIERLENPTPYAFADLVGRYNRRFDKSAKSNVIPMPSIVEKPDIQRGLSVSPGIAIPRLLYVDDQLTDVFCGLSVTKGPKDKHVGSYYSLGAYIPAFSITTEYDRLDHSIPRNYISYDYMIMIPARYSYRFLKKKLQPEIGVDFTTYLNNDNPWCVLGPTCGLRYTPIKWVSLYCSFQYQWAQIYIKSIKYSFPTPLCLTTGISVNL